MTRTALHALVWPLLIFAASFGTTLVTRQSVNPPNAIPPNQSPVVDWLGLNDEQAAEVQKHDPDFQSDLNRLRQEWNNAQDQLIASFEKADIDDETLRAQIEAVIAAHNSLERRVADHLISVRDHLTPDQQKQLFNLCADNMRYCQRLQRWRHGQGGQDVPCCGACGRNSTSSQPAGQGQGQGQGQGHGSGAGRGWRGGRNAAP